MLSYINDLYLNIGIDYGEAFFSAIPSSPYIEFTALGDSVNYSSILSDIARYGSIFTTKYFINHLDPVARREVCFGIRHKDNERDVFIENTFSRVMDILEQDDPKYAKFKGIEALAITEMVNA